MMLRVQAERMLGGFFPSNREYSALFGMNEERSATMKPGAIVMHPGPMLRGMEMDYVVPDQDKSTVLQQVTTGVHARMAVLYTLLANEDLA